MAQGTLNSKTAIRIGRKGMLGESTERYRPMGGQLGPAHSGASSRMSSRSSELQQPKRPRTRRAGHGNRIKIQDGRMVPRIAWIIP